MLLSRAKNAETLVSIQECSVLPPWAGRSCKAAGCPAAHRKRLQLIRKRVPGALPASLEVGLLEGIRPHPACQMGKTRLQDSPGQPAEQQQRRKGGGGGGEARGWVDKCQKPKLHPRQHIQSPEVGTATRKASWTKTQDSFLPPQTPQASAHASEPRTPSQPAL